MRWNGFRIRIFIFSASLRGYGEGDEINEFGVTIGNEAVWTKIPYGDPELLGMDHLRLALERSATAGEAIDVLTSLLEKYSQGETLRLTVSSLCRSSTSWPIPRAWILETAGTFWAAEDRGYPIDLRTF